TARHTTRRSRQRRTRPETSAAESHATSFRRDLLLASRPGGREIVEKEDRVPHLFLRQELLPRRHSRVPRPTFVGQSGASLRDSPEQKRLAEHRDRALVAEVRGNRVESVHEHAVAGQVVAVAEDTVLV